MRNFSQIITEPYRNKDANTNEVVGVLFASAVLAYACSPLLTRVGEAIKTKAEQKSKDGFSFWDWIFGRKKDKEVPKKSTEEPKTDDPKTDDLKNNEVFNSLLMMARKSNENNKNANEKKKNESMIKLLTACSFDKDGNEIPLEDRIDKMKDSMSPEQFKAFKKDMTDTYEKNKDNQDFKDALKKAKDNIKPEEYDKMIEEAKKEAKTTLDQLDKEKEEIEKHEEEIKKLEDEINGGDEKDKEIRELKKQLEELKKNPPQTITSLATGVSAGGESTSSNDDSKSDNNDSKSDDDDSKNDDTESKYTIKDEEVTDPETGKKKKVKTHTGPRGGKFYYPDGKPKTPENKVYLESILLQDYLLESII